MELLKINNTLAKNSPFLHILFLAFLSACFGQKVSYDALGTGDASILSHGTGTVSVSWSQRKEGPFSLVSNGTVLDFGDYFLLGVPSTQAIQISNTGTGTVSLDVSTPTNLILISGATTIQPGSSSVLVYQFAPLTSGIDLSSENLIIGISNANISQASFSLKGVSHVSPLIVNPSSSQATPVVVMQGAQVPFATSGGSGAYAYSIPSTSSLAGTVTNAGLYQASNFPTSGVLQVVDSNNPAYVAQIFISVIAPIDFGGIWGVGSDANGTGVVFGGPNPSCAADFTVSQVLGSNDGGPTVAANRALVLCWRYHTPGVAPPFDFNGMFGKYVPNNGIVGPEPILQYPNAATGAATCSSNFYPTKVHGAVTPTGNVLNYEIDVCQRPQHVGSADTVSGNALGGMYGYGYSVANSATIFYPNPVTGRQSCPYGTTARQVSGTLNVDYNLWVCM